MLEPLKISVIMEVRAVIMEGGTVIMESSSGDGGRSVTGVADVTIATNVGEWPETEAPDPGLARLGGEPEHAKGRNGKNRGRRPAMPGLSDGLDDPEVADPAAAVGGRVGVDHLAPPPGRRQPDPVVNLRLTPGVGHPLPHPRIRHPTARRHSAEQQYPH